jgi:hypothetical protein
MKLILPFFLFIIGCASRGPVPQQSVVQRFETQGVYQDKKNGKTQQMNLEVVARKNQNLRIDAKVIFGVHIASVVMNPDRIQLALHAEKKSYEGPASQRVLQRALKLPLHPLVFHAMLYRQAMNGSGWSCAITTGGMVSSCMQKQAKLKIVWEDIEDNEMMVTAENPNFLFQWKIAKPEDVQERPAYFVLKIPGSYDKLSL